MTERSQTDEFGKTLYVAAVDADKKIVEAVAEVASARSVSRAQVATAWMLGRPGVTAPIIGASKMHHLTEAAGAVDLALKAEEVAKLESPYVPHPVLGFS